MLEAGRSIVGWLLNPTPSGGALSPLLKQHTPVIDLSCLKGSKKAKLTMPGCDSEFEKTLHQKVVKCGARLSVRKSVWHMLLASVALRL
jgi:hypothetical protein